MKTVTLTPTTEGYAAMARVFAEAVVNDARIERRHDTGALLGALIQLVAHLATVQKTEAEVLALVDTLAAAAARPRHVNLRDCECGTVFMPVHSTLTRCSTCLADDADGRTR